MNEREMEFAELLAAVTEGRADEAQRRRLESLLRESAEWRELYVRQMRVHALLEFHGGREMVRSPGFSRSGAWPAETGTPNREPFWRGIGGHRRWLPIAVAAVLVLGTVGGWMLNRPAAVRAEVVEARNVANTFQAGSRVSLRTLQLASGTLRVRLDSGALVNVIAPAEVEFLDAMRLRVRRGKVTAEVGSAAKGFSIETAQARVVDLGTKFGVDASDSNHTDIIVFQGEVRVFNKAASKSDAASAEKLTTGQALRVDKSRRLFRIVNVTSGGREEDWSTRGALPPETIITAVRDSMEGAQPSLRNFYRIVPGGLREDARAYADSPHEWNGLDASGLPGWMLGADLVQTFNTDQFNWFMHLTVTVARPCVLYVLADRRNPPPAWLRERFTDTGVDIGWEYADPAHGIVAAKGSGRGRTLFPFRVWKLEVRQPGEVKLGPPYFEKFKGPADVRPNWMYGIAAKPLP